MKIGAEDKIQALRRSEQYRKDFDAYLKEIGGSLVYDEAPGPPLTDGYVGSPGDFNLKLTKAGEKLCLKYNLLIPYDPEQPYSEDDIWYTSPIVTFLDHPREWIYTKAHGRHGSDEKKYTHINGKLVLMIDLDKAYSKEQTRKAIDIYLKRWKPDGEERTKTGFSDIWEVFDMKKDEGKKLLEITGELYGFKKHPDNLPAYNKKVNAQYQQVSRAYRKAKAIIKLIETPPEKQLHSLEDLPPQSPR